MPMTARKIGMASEAPGMPDALLDALDRLAMVRPRTFHARTEGPAKLASEILAGRRGRPMPNWTPWWVDR